MVKMPRQIKRYSPSAGKHTMHTVERVKRSAHLNSSGVREDSVRLWLVTEVFQDQNLMVEKNQPSESISYLDAQRLEKRTMHPVKEQKNSN